MWIAPPLSGLIVQPIVGSVSDASTLRWGRRRPYMMVCAGLVAGFLCVLAWAAEIVGAVVRGEEGVVVSFLFPAGWMGMRDWGFGHEGFLEKLG